MDLKRALEDLGLSARDAELYLALLRVGESPVGPLIEQTGMHREMAYGGLKRLQQQGLIQSLEKKKIRHYQISDPQILVRRAKERTNLALALLPSLQRALEKIPVSIRIFEGSEGFEEIQKDIQDSLRNRESYFIIGGAGTDWYEVTNDYYLRYRKQSMRRGIRSKMVTFKNEAKGVLAHEPPGFCTVRVLPQEFSVPSATKIYADKIVIQIFGERPIAIQIRSEAISKSYRQFFNALWRIAKPFPQS